MSLLRGTIICSHNVTYSCSSHSLPTKTSANTCSVGVMCMFYWGRGIPHFQQVSLSKEAPPDWMWLCCWLDCLVGQKPAFGDCLDQFSFGGPMLQMSVAFPASSLPASRSFSVAMKISLYTLSDELSTKWLTNRQNRSQYEPCLLWRLSLSHLHIQLVFISPSARIPLSPAPPVLTNEYTKVSDNAGEQSLSWQVEMRNLQPEMGLSN